MSKSCTSFLLLLFMLSCVHGVRFRKKERVAFKKHLNKEIDKLAVALNVPRDAFEVLDLFIFQRDLENIYDDLNIFSLEGLQRAIFGPKFFHEFV